ncbi:hypothetical protein EIP86_002378 [Pleurotus ostreatoroseus]|nr:hypothetical protein EIP86_002378 [Pleurotus ostreatoroseus]
MGDLLDSRLGLIRFLYYVDYPTGSPRGESKHTSYVNGGEWQVWSALFDGLKAAWKAGTPPESLVSSYLTARAAKGHEYAPGRGLTEDGWMRDKLIAYTAANVVEAGSDTTSTTLEMFVLFMLAHPQILHKAREELDRVVGTDRMPTFEDESNLPYVVACIKETLRRRTVVPLGVPHMASEDDEYKGFFIPKGSTVIGNIWAIHMDPSRYTNPEAFDPQRFYEPGKPTRFGSGSGQDSDRDIYAFGWGRRFCVGYSFAESALFILCARIIWAFDFYPMKDEAGKPIIPDVMDESSFSNGLVCAPHPFNVGWKPRDSRRAELIERGYAEAQEEWLTRGMDQDER